ncbi:hypothetical protein YC2023_002334 [Brassica napus]
MWHRSFSTTPDQLTKKKWDALVISGGYNSLVAAAYLARGSLSVAVLERCHVIGRAAMTEEIVPGFKFSRCSIYGEPCISSNNQEPTSLQSTSIRSKQSPHFHNRGSARKRPIKYVGWVWAGVLRTADHGG